MGASAGDLLAATDEEVEAILSHGRRIVAVAEDELVVDQNAVPRLLRRAIVPMFVCTLYGDRQNPVFLQHSVSIRIARACRPCPVTSPRQKKSPSCPE